MKKIYSCGKNAKDSGFFGVFYMEKKREFCGK